jgi:arsenate reductase (glutaredoxin)
MTYRYLHNPRCSKSRQGKSFLEEAGVEFEVVEYLKTPLTEDELRDLCKKLNLPPSQVVRKKEEAFKKRGLNEPGVDEDAILRAMAEDPVLLERPILIHGKKAVIGRPTENLGELVRGK